jgi:hypothetical protein
MQCKEPMCQALCLPTANVPKGWCCWEAQCI